MMGELAPDQNNLFYDFCLDQHVPHDHLLRQIGQVLDLGDLRQHLRSYYSHTGRPSIDPELMIRMLIVGYCYGIRSERRLCDEVHVPDWDKSEKNTEMFNRSDFNWDVEGDCYHCPGGQQLQSRRRNFKDARGATVTVDKTIIYSASQHDCKICELKSRCCPNTTHRKIARSIYEDSRDVARAISQTPEYLQSRKDRKKVEILFAHLKRIMKLDRLRLRGLTGAHDEFLMAATVQNLKKLAKLRYKPPDNGIGVPIPC